MNKFRLLVTTLLVVLCTGFYSCGEEEDSEEWDSWSAFYLEYGISDYKDIEMLNSNQCIGSSIYQLYDKNHANFWGLKNNHLWIASFDIKTKQKIMEWTDTKEFEKVQRIDLGYGEYNEIRTSPMSAIQILTYNDSFVAQLLIEKSGYISKHEVWNIFKTPTSFKEVKEEITKSSFTFFSHWYQDSYFVGKTCYSFDGDIRYIAKSYVKGIPVSYEEAIYASEYSISRYNLKDDITMWNTRIIPPFDVPFNARWECTLLEKLNNIWKYKANIVFYDGTKKDFTFSINTDNGKIQ